TNRERPPTSRRVSGSSPAAELPAPCPRGLAVTRFPSSRGRRPVRSVRPAKPAAALRTLSLMAASSLAATVQMASSEFPLLDCLGIRVAAGVPTAMCPLNAQPLQLSSDFPGKSKTPGQGRKIEAGRSHDSEANVAEVASIFILPLSIGRPGYRAHHLQVGALLSVGRLYLVSGDTQEEQDGVEVRHVQRGIGGAADRG